MNGSHDDEMRRLADAALKSCENDTETPEAWAERMAPYLAQPDQPQASGVAAVAYHIHPETLFLVKRFSAALVEKLAAAEKKYGYSDEWMRDDWIDECRDHLRRHVEKGDPRDVAAYCAFLWHHGARTSERTHTAASDAQASGVAATGEPPKVTEAKAESGPVALMASAVAEPTCCEVLAREYRKASGVVRRIAGMGADSTDKEIADEAIRIARLWKADDSHDEADICSRDVLAAAPAAPERAEGQRVTDAMVETAVEGYDYVEKYPPGTVGYILARRKMRAALEAALGAAVREGETK
jgi:hypothetical protein